MCPIVQKKYIPLIFLRGCRAAGLCVNMLKDNIQKDVKVIALLTMRSEINLINK